MKTYFFTAEWCSACKQMHPVIEQLRKEGYKIQTVDVDSDSKLSSRYKIGSLPTTVATQDEKEIKRFVGVVAIEKLREVLKKDLEYKVW
ncbi:thioredoxin family protein [Candidatus Pacearchaeota archaeon]|jgi:thioredoxin-like negative regulator of GroEL|nr:thioredoxin family protein [Candidatus Pacearchaeota archaeon]